MSARISTLGLNRYPVTGQRIGMTTGNVLKPKNNVEDPDAIVAPERTTIADSLASIKKSGLLPRYTAVDYKPITAQSANAQQVSGITQGFGNDYYDMIEKQATKKLNDKFFGAPDSLSAQQQNMMNRRGLIGSGIETSGQNQLYKTFGDEFVDLQSNLSQQRAQDAQALAFKNKDIETGNVNTANEFSMANTRSANEIAAQNAAQSLAAAQKNRDFQGFLSELGLRAGADEAKTSTDYATKMFESQVNLRENDRQYITDILGQLNTSLQNENIDPETRQIFEDIFGSNVSAALGPKGGVNNSLANKNGQGFDAARSRIREIDAQLKKIPAGGRTQFTRDQLQAERDQLYNQLLGI